MIDFALFLAASGALAAGLWDLKTTEIPDEIPFLMACSGLFIWFVYALTYGNFFPLFMSMGVGTSFLLFGWTLYKAGQWGGGDAKLMSGIGFLVPYFPNVFIFPLTFMANVFLIGAIYVIAYSLILGLLNRGVFRLLVSDITKNILIVAGLPLAAASCLYALMLYAGLVDITVLSYLLLSFTLLMVFWRYAKIIEKKVFRKTIDASELRIGDVPEDSKLWDGIDENQLNKLRKSGKKITIKEGVRFGPVFFIALLFTIAFGNFLFLGF